uniref:NADH dehydrogenase [ubiquinone] 1 beta subcomplex subunit 7 n=1 Tax=Rhipicephalus sanguineus TaxID=34632 RepID=C9W1C1_RHISA
MGQYYGTMTTTNGNPLVTVVKTEKKVFQPKHDPMFGFPNGRKERQMVATELEMESANVPQQYRGYCAHKLIELRACMKQNFPFVTTCGHEKHEYASCMYDDQMIRYKEYERERRLKAREERRAKKNVELLLQ